MISLPSGGGFMQWARNVLTLLKGIASIIHGLGVAVISVFLMDGAFIMRYWEEIRDVLLAFPGWLYRVAQSTIFYVEKITFYLQQIGGFFEGPFAPYAAFINGFLPLQEAVELLVFIGAFSVAAFVLRLMFKFSIIFR